MSPTPRLLAALGAWLALGVAASLWPFLRPAWTALGAALAALAALDAWLVWRAPGPELSRRLPAALALGVWTPVRLEVRNPGRRALRLSLFDHHPPALAVEGLPLALEVSAGAGVEAGYRVRAERRGAHGFQPCAVRRRSPLGLFDRQQRLGEREPVHVYPNFRAATGYELLAQESRTGALGIRHRPRRGEGLEFHQLREYRPGDPLRQIDWKATARLGRTISREYQDERDQQVVFLLDCGRRLHAKDGVRSHFDSALDALLLLSHVALRQGDAVGLLTFSGPARFVAPRKGMAHLSALLGAVYDLESGPRAADYRLAAREVAHRIRKRALVVLISNVRDEDAEELVPALRLLSRRHLVLLASLREAVLGEALRGVVRDLDEALRVAAIHRYLDERRRGLQSAAHAGALLLDCEPDAFAVSLVNGYLDVKAAGVL